MMVSLSKLKYRFRSVSYWYHWDRLRAPFESTGDFFNHIGQQNLDHLLKQRNSIDDADDARLKFISRRLVQVTTSKYISKEHDDLFALFCDDFRPSNFILDDEVKIWRIDLEWTYAAPYQTSIRPHACLYFVTPVGSLKCQVSWTYSRSNLRCFMRSW